MNLARRPWLFLGPAAVLAGGAAVALTFTSDHDQHPGLSTALLLFVSLAFVGAGLIGWTRRPANRTGMLMVGVGFGVLVTSLSDANYSAVRLGAAAACGGRAGFFFVNANSAKSPARGIPRARRRERIPPSGVFSEVFRGCCSGSQS